MNSLVKTNFKDEADKEIVLQKKRELIASLEAIVWTTDDTLQKLVDTYNDAKDHWSWQALQVRLDIVKYINQLKGIDVSPAWKPIQIAIFNYWKKENLEY